MYIRTQRALAVGVSVNSMQKNRYRKSDLAKDLNIPPQRISSFLSFKKTTNLDFFDRAFRVMGRRLTFSI